MTSLQEFMFCINRQVRKFILFQCQDGARGGNRPPCPPVATPLILLDFGDPVDPSGEVLVTQIASPAVLSSHTS